MLTPASRSFLNIRSQKILHRLDHQLTLSICLRMKRRAKAEIPIEQAKKGLPKLASETGIPMRYYNL